MRDERVIGLFSYAVPQFTWDHCHVSKWAHVALGDFRDYDVVVIEDGSFLFPEGTGPPVVGVFWDTNATPAHATTRRMVANECDLALVGHDPLTIFDGIRPPVRRLTYCVNDRVFCDYGQPKTVDVAWHMNTRKSHRRQAALTQIDDARNGWLVDVRTIGPTLEYARAFNRARISMNVKQVDANRPHRVFDAMACKTCVLTDPLPVVEEPVSILPGEHYATFEGNPAPVIEYLLDSGDWDCIAAAGYAWVHAQHTWRVRAGQLRALLHEELGI
jgi:spore maturation protein CgeB